MMSVYRHFLKPYMFRREAEEAHHQTMAWMRRALKIPGARSWFRKQYQLNDPALRRTVMGLDFPNPVGMAAGFDKDGKYIDLLPYLGFGFVEIGTVTPLPQVGNPKPRLFRLEKDEALINRMGFNNDGVEAMVRRLEKRERNDFIVGGNIGKNKDTPNEEAHKDYSICAKALDGLVDFFVINVSSPNTPGLRELQNEESLKKIIGSVQDQNTAGVPILLKVAPDMELELLESLIHVVDQTGINGLINHNTTVRRDGLLTSASEVERIGAGGLSGKPLDQYFRQRTAEIRSRLSEDKVLIASGGIHDATVAVDRMKHGADLVEVFTGMIFNGPGFVKSILEKIQETGF